MRTKNVMRNIGINILTQIVITVLGFLSRKVFIDNLGTEYLGINGLLYNVISMLSLVEGGIGTSIIFNLYKPLADDDRPRIIALVQLYKKLYGILAIVILFLSICLYPFLGLLMRDYTGVPYLTLIYFIFVAKNMISYLNAHRWSLINADQKGYVLARYNLIFNIVTTLSKIAILYYTKNYVLYLLIEAGIFVVQNIWNGRIVNNKYPYINTREKYYVEKQVKENLITNVKAIFLHNIGSYCVFGTDNILISALVSIQAVGFYSNYTLVINQLSTVVKQVLEGISQSVGNLIATESKEKSYKIFKVVYLINFWIYSFAAIFLYNLLEPFIGWCFGKDMILNKLVLVISIANFYLTGLRSSVNIFKTKAGIFKEDKYVPLIESFINLSVSIILAKYLGLAGILIGTAISTISLPLWVQPKLVYNKVFNMSVAEYFKKYCIYLILTIIVGAITTFTCNILVLGDGFFSLVYKGIICVLIPNIIYVLLFYRTEEFKYLYNIGKSMIIKIKGKVAFNNL